ncbi:MAG: hypothetical protein RLZZ490_270 [Cyanobacteriota bacterium]|jgi:tetratricopeptide (TPR) repeat protein
MSLVQNGVIEDYIQRVTELSQSTQRIPTTSELEAIATELGIDPAEIQAAQKHSQDHYTRAQGYMRLKYWDDAIAELQEAIAFNPSQPEMLICLGQAHLGRWRQKHQKEDVEQLHLRVKQCLSIQPDSEGALNLLATFRQTRQNRAHIFMTTGVFMGAILLGGVGYLLVQGGLPFVIQERSRLENLEQKIEQQRQELDDLRRGQAQARDRLREELQRQQMRELVPYGDRLNRLQSELDALKQQVRDYQAQPRLMPRPEPTPMVSPSP